MQSADTQKNYKAAAITFVVHAVLLILFFVITIAMTGPTPPTVEEGIEVNLGNSDIGFGDVEPMIPGDPAPETAQEQSAPKQQTEQPDEDSEKEISERDDPETPEIKKAPTTKPTKTPPKENLSEKASKPATNTVANTKPAPKQEPKGVMKSPTGTGPGGNNADGDNYVRNQGNDPGSVGNKGASDGNPNSKNYSTKGGVSSGNRKIIINNYTFPGDLPAAKIIALVSISPEGKGTFLQIDGNKSVGYTSAHKNSIIDCISKMTFEKGVQQTIPITFNFVVRS